MRLSTAVISVSLACSVFASPVILSQDEAQTVFGPNGKASKDVDSHDRSERVSSGAYPNTADKDAFPRVSDFDILEVLEDSIFEDSSKLEFLIEGLELGLDSADSELMLVETAPGERTWVTDSEKWALRREGINFIDVTDEAEESYVPLTTRSTSTVKYPSHIAQNKTLQPLLKELNSSHMRSHLEKFTSFHTRYYKSDTGRQSSEWLLSQVIKAVKASGADEYGATVKHFKHPWGQNSVIATIPGKSNNTVVVGAHQDSINLFFPSLLAAPGADDDGSGTVTILEALRVLLQDENIAQGKAENTIEFHWYSAEEGGLLGSRAIFQEYGRNGRDVKAMLQQDMTGYVQKTLDAGKPESVGVITDFVDPGLTDFIKMIVSNYCTIPYTLTKCGYACSDHASASKAGYPSAFVIESDFEYSDKKIHTTEDKIEFLSFPHMLQHARLTLAFAHELAFAKFA